MGNSRTALLHFNDRHRLQASQQYSTFKVPCPQMSADVQRRLFNR